MSKTLKICYQANWWPDKCTGCTHARPHVCWPDEGGARKPYCCAEAGMCVKARDEAKE